MSKILTLELLLSQGWICEMMVPEILTWVETQLSNFFKLQTLSQWVFILVWWKSVYNFLFLRSPEDITLLNWKHRWLYYFLCSILQKNLISHSHATLLVMKRLHKQYFHLTSASGILKDSNELNWKNSAQLLQQRSSLQLVSRGYWMHLIKKYQETVNMELQIRIFTFKFFVPGVH